MREHGRGADRIVAGEGEDERIPPGAPGSISRPPESVLGAVPDPGESDLPAGDLAAKEARRFFYGRCAHGTVEGGIGHPCGELQNSGLCQLPALASSLSLSSSIVVTNLSGQLVAERDIPSPASAIERTSRNRGQDEALDALADFVWFSGMFAAGRDN